MVGCSSLLVPEIMFILKGGSPFVYVCFNPHLSLNQQAKTSNVNLGSIIIILLVTSPFFTMFHHFSTMFHHVSW